ncbi:hypothetical protein [Flavobacterium sp.]|uniref:hypothetical protein n=1 Tax=Flavobacterium sp. TaxID=239 RepID=UPI00374CE9DE
MTIIEKLAVEKHLLKASKLEERDRRYQAIEQLFRIYELDFMFYDMNFALDIRRGLGVLGLECDVRRNKIVLEKSAIIQYYEKVMGLKAEPIEEEKSYYQRQKGL